MHLSPDPHRRRPELTVSRNLRILILLLILTPLVFLFRSESDPVPDWDRTLSVAVYPYNVAGSEAVARHIAGFDQIQLEQIADFFARESQRHQLALEQPFVLLLGKPINYAPPPPPRRGQGLARLRWALGLRWWRWRFDHQGLAPDIVVVARFNAANEAPPSLHSIGVAELGLVVVNLPALDSHRGYAQVLIAHEILHTVGASDLYHPATGLPQFPAGYVEASLEPRYPQDRAELMAGRIPIAPGRALQATRLEDVQIGPRTAREIGWPGL